MGESLILEAYIAWIPRIYIGSVQEFKVYIEEKERRKKYY